ncbi:MAG: sodium ion-translocating decarboxylase subunit beta [bacterium]
MFIENIINFINSTGFAHLSWQHIVMLSVGCTFIYLAIKKNYEPMLLLPIGFGMLIGNIPFIEGLGVNIYEEGSLLNILFEAVHKNIFPPLIFLGIGAMTDFTALLSNPKTLMLGAAAQVGIFASLLCAYYLGFSLEESAAIGIIGGADGPTSIYTAMKLAPHLLGPIAMAAYSYMALVPVIQPPLMKLATTKEDRLIRMKSGRTVKKAELVIFPIVGFIISALLAPASLPLIGMLFLGNLLKESGVTDRLAKTAANSIIDTSTIIIGVVVGASARGDMFLTWETMKILILGCFAFAFSTVGGVLFVKFINLFMKKENRINPLIGSAGVSAFPAAARVSQMVGREYDKHNHLLMHAMGANLAGQIASAVAAGILLSFF